MRFSIAVSALFAGMAIAAPAVTDTVYATETETITSCAATVTDCPARASTMTSVMVITSAAPVTTSAPVAAAFNNATAAAFSLSTVTLYSTDEITITSCASSVVNCPARTSLTSYATGSSVISVAVAPVSSAAFTAAPIYPTGLNSTVVSGPTGTVASASVGTAASSAYSGPAYTGAANSLNAGAALAGLGALAAFML